METLKQAFEDHEMISIVTLRDLGRQSLSKIFAQKEDGLTLPQVQRLWDGLIRTACHPAVADKYLTAACNAICVFLKSGSESFDQQVRTFIYSRSTWAQSFEVVHKAFGDGKTKPALQVLETSTELLKRAEDQDLARLILERAIEDMAKIVVTGRPRIRLKEACTVLFWFLRKSISIVPLSQYFPSKSEIIGLEFEQRSSHYNVDRKHYQDETPAEVFFLALLMTVQLPEPRTASLKLFSFLCSKGENHDYSSNIPSASRMIEIFLSANETALTEFTSDVFPAIINDRSQLDAFLSQYSPNSTSTAFQLDVSLAILEVGRQKGLLLEPELPLILNGVLDPSQRKLTEGSNKMRTFEMLLSCSEPRHRLQAYSLITMSPSTNIVIPEQTLTTVSRTFKYLYDDSDAYYRDEFISILRRLLKRMERSLQAELREHSNPSHSNVLHPVFEQYSKFLRKYLKFLKYELGPHVSYPRHILALQSLLRVLDTDGLADLCSESVTISTYIEPLMSLVDDPFEDVRFTAASVLAIIGTYDPSSISSKLCDAHILKKFQIISSRTSRADHADALGRIHMLHEMVLMQSFSKSLQPDDPSAWKPQILSDLIIQLQSHLNSCTRLKPEYFFALHGNLLGIMYLLDSLKVRTSITVVHLIPQIISVCTLIWQLVQPELCVDTPERTTEGDDQLSFPFAGPKDLLAFSWRALRDSSLVMQSILRLPQSEGTESIYKVTGDLCLDQLTRLRHRGAFSTVAQTYILCCQKVRDCSSLTADNSLLESWYQSAIQEIEKQSTKLTRRSAGLPAIFAALLDSNDPKSFNIVIEQLVQIAVQKPVEENVPGQGDEQKLPQVHALNCLKDVMLDSRFRVITEGLVVSMLNLAAKCLASKNWAIRNCGLMLFRSSINRLTPDASSHHIPENRSNEGIGMDTPLKIAVNLLVDVAPDSQTISGAGRLSEIVFAALDLLGRIPVQDDNEVLINKLFSEQLGSPLWSVREHAARLRALATRKGSEVTTLQKLLLSPPPESEQDQNDFHGKLLCSRYLLQNWWANHGTSQDLEGLSQVLPVLERVVQDQSKRLLEPIARAAYLDIINDVCISSMGVETLQQRLQRCSEVVIRDISSENWTEPSSLLSRAVLLNNCLRQAELKQRTQQDTHEQIHNNSYGGNDLSNMYSDLDATIYVFQELTERAVPICPTGFVNIFFGATIVETSDDVRSAAMRGLACCLQNSSVALSSSQVKNLENTLCNQYLSSRELLQALLLLAAQLVRNAVRMNLAEPSLLISRLVSMLEDASMDELETPTRMAAALSIRSLVPQLSCSSDVTTFIEEYHLRVLILIYGFLNDDDEDIREVAVGIVHALLHDRGVDDDTVSGCATSAREGLQQLLFTRFGHNPDLTAHVCQKIIGVPSSVTTNQTKSLYAYCRQTSIKPKIMLARRRINVLFAEEKQNLYIDDISESKAWASILHTGRIEKMNVNVVSALQQWTCDALVELIAVLDDDWFEQAIFGPVGVTYNEDILIVFVQVVTMAEILVKSRGSEQKVEEHQSVIANIKDRLKSLHEICHKNDAHETALEAIDSAYSALDASSIK